MRAITWVLSSTFILVANVADAATYTNPTYDGRRLDWCLTWASNCGERAADDFCRMKGYRYAKNWEIDHNIGRTKLIGTGDLCNASGCDGFKSIECSSWGYQYERFYETKYFSHPEFMHYPLDWCLVYGSECGKNTANAYCRMKGYEKATSWSKSAHPGHWTRVIGDGRWCNPNQHTCDTFGHIRCAR